MNYYIGQELTLPKVRITETWGGVSGQIYYRTDVGVSFMPEELEKLCPPPTPRAAIDDYFPMVKECVIAVSKYEGMTDEQLMSNVCYRGGCSDSRTRVKECPFYRLNTVAGCTEYLENHPSLRYTLIAYCEAEDAAREQP